MDVYTTSWLTALGSRSTDEKKAMYADRNIVGCHLKRVTWLVLQSEYVVMAVISIVETVFGSTVTRGGENVRKVNDYHNKGDEDNDIETRIKTETEKKRKGALVTTQRAKVNQLSYVVCDLWRR
jgi:hypothetical protein